MKRGHSEPHRQGFLVLSPSFSKLRRASFSTNHLSSECRCLHWRERLADLPATPVHVERSWEGLTEKRNCDLIMTRILAVVAVYRLLKEQALAVRLRVATCLLNLRASRKRSKSSKSACLQFRPGRSDGLAVQLSVLLKAIAWFRLWPPGNLLHQDRIKASCV